jgi:Protein of unknown function (DUF559)
MIDVPPCTICGAPARQDTRYQRYLFKKTGRGYCSSACAAAYAAKVSSETMAVTNTKYASARMKINNPMASAETRAKMSETLKRIGHAPTVRGGNGKGLTTPQAALLSALAAYDPIAEHTVRTGFYRGVGGMPSHYKIDIALPGKMIAIEIDGGSHGTLERIKQDAKKDAFLVSAGWRVLRFTNRQILESMPTCYSRVVALVMA